MRRELVFIIVASMLSAIGSGMFGPIYALYIADMGGNVTSVGIAYGIFWIMVGAMSIPFGWLSDKVGRKKMIIAGNLLGALASFLFVFTASPSDVYMIEALGGLAVAMETPALSAMLSEITTEGKRGREFGIYDSSINIAYGLAMIASGIIVALLGFVSVFMASSVLQFSSAAVVSRMKMK